MAIQPVINAYLKSNAKVDVGAAKIRYSFFNDMSKSQLKREIKRIHNELRNELKYPGRAEERATAKAEIAKQKSLTYKIRKFFGLEK